MIDKVVSINRAMENIHDGMTLMISGFAQGGSPRHLIKAVSETGVKNLSTISDDLGLNHRGFQQTIAALINNHQISKAKCSFLGQNKEASTQYVNGELEVEFIPMGTFAERIRCGGCGIGGFLTKTGVGTLIEEGKQTLVVDGEKYILETPLTAEVALIKAWKADRFGNAIFRYNSVNFNKVMAMAADTVILEVEEIVDTGTIEPDQVELPGVFVDYIVVSDEEVL